MRSGSSSERMNGRGRAEPAAALASTKLPSARSSQLLSPRNAAHPDPALQWHQQCSQGVFRAADRTLQPQNRSIAAAAGIYPATQPARLTPFHSYPPFPSRVFARPPASAPRAPMLPVNAPGVGVVAPPAAAPRGAAVGNAHAAMMAAPVASLVGYPHVYLSPQQVMYNQQRLVMMVPVPQVAPPGPSAHMLQMYRGTAPVLGQNLPHNAQWLPGYCAAPQPRLPLLKCPDARSPAEWVASNAQQPPGWAAPRSQPRSAGAPAPARVTAVPGGLMMSGQRRTSVPSTMRTSAGVLRGGGTSHIRAPAAATASTPAPARVGATTRTSEEEEEEEEGRELRRRKRPRPDSDGEGGSSTISVEARPDSGLVGAQHGIKRRRFSASAVAMFETVFTETPHPGEELLARLATSAEETVQRVHKWFHNRRTRARVAAASADRNTPRPSSRHVTWRQRARLADMFEVEPCVAGGRVVADLDVPAMCR